MGKINLKKLKIEGAALASDGSLEYMDNTPIPSGLDPLDLILGGGLMYGRVYLLSGEKSAGKSTLLHSIQSGIQQHEGVCVHAESESTIDLERCKMFGVDPEALLVSDQSIQVLEEGFEWLKTSMLNIKKHYPDTPLLLSWDTYQSTVTRAQMASTSGGKLQDVRKEMDQFAGGQQEEARIIKTKLKELVHLLNRNKSMLLLLSQVYDNRDMYGGGKFVVSGGHGLNHHLSTHLQLRKSSKIYHKDHPKLVIGHQVVITAEKNKQAPPHLQITMPLYFAKGFSPAKAIHNFCVDHRLVGSGTSTIINSPFGYNDVRLQLGRYFTQYFQGMEEYGFYHWMVLLMQRFLADIYPSLNAKYTEMANQKEKDIRTLLESGDMLMTPQKDYKL